MTKYRVVCLFVTVAAGVCLATAQSSQVRSSSTKSSPDPLQAATKPLTPKSAMPPQRQPSVAMSNPSKSNGKTTAELTRLEQQKVTAARPKNSGTGAAKSASAKKPADTSAKGSSGINFQYQKPVGGMQASMPGANSKNSSVPRVKKN